MKSSSKINFLFLLLLTFPGDVSSGVERVEESSGDRACASSCLSMSIEEVHYDGTSLGA